MRRIIGWLALGVLAALIGCDAGAPAEPRSDATPIVGPSPLRRLSNTEYLNALHDLFPDQDQSGLPELPTDVNASGFENAAESQQPSDVRIARYETIANVYADSATKDSASIRALLGCDYATPTESGACARQFFDRVGRRIFRRPLTDDERDRMTTRFHAWSAAIDFEAAVRLSLAVMLQSPQFLYRPEPQEWGVAPVGMPGTITPIENYAMASRLSFFLWESVPDDALLDAAKNGELTTEEGLRRQATRMLKDDKRGRRALWSFHRQWLGLDRILTDEHLVRSADVDKAWTHATQVSALEESRLFIENTLAGAGPKGDVDKGGSFVDLMTSRRAWVDREMARIYGVDAPKGTSFSARDLPEGERAGILTRGAFLAAYSHRGATSPPIRGSAVQLRLLCRMPQTPPPDADLSQPRAKANQGPQTNRTLFEERTSPAQCQTCHVGLNGIGFGFESYKASGAFQALDNGLPVDATGAIHGTDVDGPFVDARAMSAQLAKSRVVRACATRQWVRYALGRAPVIGEEIAIDTLTDRFMEGSGNIRQLLLDIVTLPSFRLRVMEEID